MKAGVKAGMKAENGKMRNGVCTLGWYAMPRQGMGFETRFDIEVERNRTGLKRRSVRRSVRRTPRPSNPVSFHRPGGSGVSDPSYRKSASETTIQAAKPPL